MAEQNMMLKLENREVLTVDKTEDVVSFSDTKVVLKTSDGVLTVMGNDLQIKRFGANEFAVVSGRINSLLFSESFRSGKAFLSKIVK